LVTTGGGALPLPLPTKHPAKLNEATTSAHAKASFFIIASRLSVRPLRENECT
jgi:hypothetical protein